MKKFLIAATLAAATASLAAPALAGDVGVSLSYGEPGFYGRLDIGDYPQPQVIYRRPVVIERVEVDRPPVYLHVPPGHAKNWRKHCGKYGACGERVYFVQDNWYNREYVPRYRERQQDRRDDRHEEHRDEHRGDRNNDHRGDNQGHGGKH
ncbi:MAG: hypothetical protein NTY41_03885 [Proteobacteria bacterium]|nr:hypothetical protein [Pseudomonadota bacterium]